MGAEQSSNVVYDQAISSFNGHEQDQLKEIYSQLCGGGKRLSVQQLQVYCAKCFSQHMSSGLHQYMKLFESRDLQQNVSTSFEGFVICMAHALKGSVEEKAQLIGCMAVDSVENEPTLKQIVEVIECFWNSYATIFKSVNNYATWKLIASKSEDIITRSLVHDLVSNGKQLQCEMALPAENTRYNLSVLTSWLQNSPLLLSVMETVFRFLFPVGFAFDTEYHRGTQFPLCANAKWDKCSTILDSSSIVYLNFHLPQELRNEWRFLYNSKLHGESYSTMCRKISDQGPSILIFRDTKGHVFGGFAAESWRLGSQFVGSPSCFLFNLRPYLEIYPSTGYNNHFMYFNHGQETLPNGLGMGGQLRYFGLFLDEQFTFGHSKAEPHCTTYTSPQLSSDANFQLETLEVWGLGSVRKPTEDDEEAQAGSILDKDPEAKAMLSLIDKGPHSEGLRDRDPMADTPEEHHLPSGLG